MTTKELELKKHYLIVLYKSLIDGSQSAIIGVKDMCKFMKIDNSLILFMSELAINTRANLYNKDIVIGYIDNLNYMDAKEIITGLKQFEAKQYI